MFLRVENFAPAMLLALGLSWVRPVRAGDAGNAGAVEGGVDGGRSCADSSSCAPPTPYCDPTNHVCIECLSDRNCPSGEVCNATLGTCVRCLSDADCPASTPYCSATAGKCVECVTSANCGSIGLVCQGGQCGWCGDGICGPKEIVYDWDLTWGALLTPGAELCPEDCASQCPTRDLGSMIGSALATVSAAGLRNLFVGNACGMGTSTGPEATFSWKAPHDGTYYFSTYGSTSAVMSTFQLVAGVCTSGTLSGCSSPMSDPYSALASDLKAGDSVLMVLELSAPSDGDLVVNVWDRPPGCDSSTCGASGSSAPDSGFGGESPALCLENARARGAVCAGTECACNHCPQDYDDCAIIPGCAAIQSCMDAHHCAGADCYLSGQCRSTIDSYGGVSSAAFRAASGLQSCELTFGCQLPCVDAGAPDAGPSSDGGHLCIRGQTIPCDCDGGPPGMKTCSADGNALDACACGSKAADSGGCGCRFTTADSGNHASFLGLVFAGALGARRARRRYMRGKSQKRSTGP